MRLITIIIVLLVVVSTNLAANPMSINTEYTPQNHVVASIRPPPNEAIIPDLGFEEYLTIQEAINAARDGDVVLVRPGTFYENINFCGKAITVKSEEGPQRTIIHGNGLTSVVTFNHGEERDSVLRGFTLRNGIGTHKILDQYLGGGVFINGSSPKITRNIIEYNETDGLLGCGGGIACINLSSPVISDNIIRKNRSMYGGGIYYSTGSNPQIIRNCIIDNFASVTGGGLLCFQGGGFGDQSMICPDLHELTPIPPMDGALNIANPAFEPDPLPPHNALTSDDVQEFLPFPPPPEPTLITDNLFIRNQAGVAGGGIRSNSSTPIVTNNTLYKNEAGLWAGGISFMNSSVVEITNTILWGNRALSSPQMMVEGLSAIKVSYSDIMGGQDQVQVSAEARVEWSDGVIVNDPLFIDEGCCDLHLACNSPCKNTGSSCAPGLSCLDWERDPRCAYGCVDIGADEQYAHLYYMGDLTPGGSFEIRVVAPANTSPVFVWVGSGPLSEPVETMYGEWWLEPPMIMRLDLVETDSSGLAFAGYTLPLNVPVPTDVYIQALAGCELTNMTILRIM